MDAWTHRQDQQWRSIRHTAFSKDAEQHRRCMALLLLQLHKINQKQFERRIRQLYGLDSILGPQAVAWGLRTMGDITPPGEDRRFYLTQADQALDDAARMKKIAKGWQAFGEHPWWVVHGKPEKTLARYNSDSILLVK